MIRRGELCSFLGKHKARVGLGLLALVLASGVNLQAQPNDPGIRGGPAGAGDPITGLTAGELAFFNNHGKPQFVQVEAVADGLGPRFNLDSCGGCHVHPATGGTSPPPSVGNPQVARAHIMAPGNTVPSFLKLNGPVREVRFVKNPDGTPDGGVHDIFVITGRSAGQSSPTVTKPMQTRPRPPKTGHLRSSAVIWR